ncbi:MAG: hypothetical protein ACRCYP_06465 [Alphaproteobacteria bacterium]
MTHPSSRLMAYLILVCIAISLSACGKKGEPTTPCQISSDFPRIYPPEAETKR